MDLVFVADGDGRKIGINRRLVRELRAQSAGKVAIIFDYNHQVIVGGALEEIAGKMSTANHKRPVAAHDADGV